MNLLQVGLSTYRLTKLVTDDYITQDLRDKIQPLRDKHPKLNYFMSCPWCISMYTGAVALTIEYTVPQLNTVLASSAITGLISTNLG